MMASMKLRLTFHLDPDVLAIDVQSFLAAVRFVLRGIFPTARMVATIEETKGPTCTQVTPSSTTPTLN